MPVHPNLQSLFTDIADSIRSKTGSSAPIVADKFPDTIRSIEADHAVEDDIVRRYLKTYTNERITEVGPYAFAANTSLRSVDLPNVERIYSYAFLDSESLNSVNCPNLLAINPYAFSGCIGLEQFLSQKLAEIHTHAFGSCRLLVKVDIFGEGVSLSGVAAPGRIYRECFSGTRLSTLIIRSKNVIPTIEEDIFGDPKYPDELCPIGKDDGYIYVPASMVEAYKADANWSKFASQIRAIEDYPEICG